MNTFGVILIIFGLGGTELIVIGMVILLFFGGKKIPQLMKGLGHGITEFKKAKGDNMPEVSEIPKKD